MALIVSPDPQKLARGTLTCADNAYVCALGRSGVSASKIEGDNTTPIGTFSLRQLFYRADRLALPATTLMTRAIERHDGWCDAPGDSHYNQLITMPHPTSAENLWREEHVYDLIVVIGYNDAPIVSGKGSAIFMHIATPDYAPTAGCVALSQRDLLSVLQTLSPDPTITIQAAR
jgi:L,D-peptidoglycan transpeptidase YkuD (ErfK/YbiS/YcfS/YnhG family)